MSVLLRLLSLLVVGCIVLQTLSVSGEEEFCELVNENALVEEYVREYAPKKPIHAVKKSTRKEGNARLLQILKTEEQKLRNSLEQNHHPLTVNHMHVGNQGHKRKLIKDGYVTLFDTKWKIPIYVSERLHGSAVYVPRGDYNFRPDPQVENNLQSSCAAYRNSGYDKGHLAASGDMTDPVTQLNTFVFTNAVPQHPNHNRVAWRNLEDYVRRNLAVKKERVLAITGVTINPSARGDWELKKDGTKVPDKMYKLIVWCENSEPKAEFILTKHEDESNPESYCASTEATKSSPCKGETNLNQGSAEIEEIVKTKTGIEYGLKSLCEENTKLSKLGKLLRRILKIKKEAKQAADQSYKAIGKQDTEQSSSSSVASFCNRVNEKLQRLASTKKVSIIPSNKESNSVLDDLGIGSFGAGCRLTSDLAIENADDSQVTTLDMIDNTQEKSLAQADQTLTAIVPEGQSLKLQDVFDIPKEINITGININVQKIINNCSANYLDIHSAQIQSFDVIPQVFSVKNTVVFLRINYGNDTNNVIAVSGQWTLGNDNLLIDVLARYNSKVSMLLLRGASKKGITVDLKKQLAGLTGTYIPIPFTSFSLTDIVVTGQIDLMKGGLTTVVVSGSIDKNKVYAVLQKPAGSSNFFAAFAAEIESVNFKEIVKTCAEIDISNIPFFGTLTIQKLGVTVSSEYITSSLLPNVFCKEDLLQNTAVTIPRGFQVFTTINFGKKSIPQKIHIPQSGSFMSWEAIGNNGISIEDLLKAISANLKLSLPPKVADILKIEIGYFLIDRNAKTFEVEFRYPGKLSYFHDYLTIIEPAVKVYVYYQQKGKVEVDVTGGLQIGKGGYMVTISRGSSNEYILTAAFNKIPVSDFIKKFRATFLPEAFQRTLEEYAKFDIVDAKLSLQQFGTSDDNNLSISGTPVISGFTSKVSAIIVRSNGKFYFIGGFQFQKVNLIKLMTKIIGREIEENAILNQELDTTVVISSIKYNGKLFDMAINRGVSVSLTLQWPQNCAKDYFCSFAKQQLKKDRLTLQGTVESTKSFQLSAEVSTEGVDLGAGMRLKNAYLQVRIGKETAVGVEGNIYLKRQGINMSAGIRVGTDGVVLEGNTYGCKRKAFGVSWLTICDFHLKVALQPTETIVGALEIGATVKLGHPSCLRTPIEATGHVGVDELNPNDNDYYYVKLNKVTMEKLLRAFCVRYKLPSALAESGFPKGFFSSFSPLGMTLPSGTSIPCGFRLKGTINILGKVARADIDINPKSYYIKMDIELPPLNIGNGLLKMYASKKDNSNGPLLKARLSWKYLPRIFAKGFVSVLGIELETYLHVTSTKFVYKISGKILSLFNAHLWIFASYTDIESAKFKVKGYFRNDFLSHVNSKIHGALRSSSKEAEKAVEDEKSKRNVVYNAFEQAKDKLTAAQEKLKGCDAAVDRAVTQVYKWQTKVDSLCSLRKCHSVCFIFCVRDVICDGINLSCKGLRALAFAGLEGAKTLLIKSKHLKHAATDALERVKSIVTAAQKALQDAEYFLQKVRNDFKHILDATEKIASDIFGVFNIRRVKFFATLDAASTGKFKVSTQVTIFNKNKSITLELDLKKIRSFLWEIGEKVITGLKKYIV